MQQITETEHTSMKTYQNVEHHKETHKLNKNKKLKT